MRGGRVLAVAVVAVVGAAGLAAGLHHSGKTTVSGENDHERLAHVRAGALAPATGRCGVELWSIKTLTDPSAGQVNLTPVTGDMAALTALPAPNPLPTTRVGPTEKTTYRLTATLTGYRLEADSDLHLVLRDGHQHSMIAEIPDPSCATSSRVAAQIAKARATFETKHNPVNGCFDCLAETVTLDGVGFFDFLHGQNGVAPNGFELHPVIGISFGGTPPPPVTTTSSTTATTTTTPTPTTKDDAVDEMPGCVTYPGRIYYHHVKQTHCAASFFTTP